MSKLLKPGLAFFLSLVLWGCQSSPEPRADNAAVPANAVPPVRLEDSPAKPPAVAIDVPKIADKSVAELDRLFGRPAEVKSIENGGEFRLYNVAGHSKGLAVRFYGGKAKSFNLIADQPFAGSKEALRRIFNLDVGDSAPVKGDNEPLTEQYRGVFGGARFKKVSAKRAGNGKGFIFVLAEVAE